MKSYKSALGKVVDMGSIIAKNEKVRAVGNMKVNARGDEIDSWGRVIKPVTTKVSQNYSNTVGNRSGLVTKKQEPEKIQADKIEQPVLEEVIQPELTQAEMDMEAEFDDDELVEQIKAEELRQEQLKEAKKGKK